MQTHTQFLHSYRIDWRLLYEHECAWRALSQAANVNAQARERHAINTMRRNAPDLAKNGRHNTVD